MEQTNQILEAFSDDKPRSKFEKSIAEIREKDVDNEHFWNNFVKAFDVEPRDHRVIKGASGVEHKLLGLGVNDKDKRLVLVSDTPTAEYASMMQVDVQSGTDLNVIVARPVAFDLAGPIGMLSTLLGSVTIDSTSLQKLSVFDGEPDQEQIQNILFKLFGQFAEQAFLAFKFTPLSVYSQFLQFSNQLSMLDFASVEKEKQDFEIDLGALVDRDVTETDRNLGVCPVPLFEFDERQMEIMLSGSKFEDMIQILRDIDVYQYFFPNPENVGLGLVDHGVSSSEGLEKALIEAPKIGHPYAGTECCSPVDADQIINDLLASNQIAEYESFSITPEGEQKRIKLSIRPHEGFVIKLLKAVSGGEFHLHLPPTS